MTIHARELKNVLKPLKVKCAHGTPPCRSCLESAIEDLQNLAAGGVVHYGYNAERLADECGPNCDRERLFAEEWALANERATANNHKGMALLSQLLHNAFGAVKVKDGERHPAEVSQRDASIAATAIQWLGTNVGIAWLDDVLRKVGRTMMTPGEMAVHQRTAFREGAAWMANRCSNGTPTSTNDFHVAAEEKYPKPKQ